MVPIDSAVEFPWLLNQGTATAMLGQREILLEFSHRTNLTAGGLPFLFWLKIRHRFYYSEYSLSPCSVRLHGTSVYVCRMDRLVSMRLYVHNVWVSLCFVPIFKCGTSSAGISARHMSK